MNTCYLSTCNPSSQGHPKTNHATSGKTAMPVDIHNVQSMLIKAAIPNTCIFTARISTWISDNLNSLWKSQHETGLHVIWFVCGHGSPRTNKPVTRKMFPFYDVIMRTDSLFCIKIYGWHRVILTSVLLYQLCYSWDEGFYSGPSHIRRNSADIHYPICAAYIFFRLLNVHLMPRYFQVVWK